MKQTFSLSEINAEDFRREEEMEQEENIEQEENAEQEGILEECVQEDDETSWSSTFQRENTFDIVSKVAYLIGIQKSIFENECQSPKIEIYNGLEKEKSARIIRNLCIVRTAIERNFKVINSKMRNYQSFFSAIEGIASENIDLLEEDGVRIGVQKKLTDYLIEVNRLISDRLNNCKSIFPIWQTGLTCKIYSSCPMD